MVTRPAWGMLAAPIDANVAVKLKKSVLHAVHFDWTGDLPRNDDLYSIQRDAIQLGDVDSGHSFIQGRAVHVYGCSDG